MELKDIVEPEAVLSGLNATSKKHLLQELAQRAEDVIGVEAREAFEAMLERERLGPTAMGQGVAIPHARIRGLKGIAGVFASLSKPVEFEAVDDEPVDLVFCLLAPEDAGADHLRALARVSRRLRDPAVCAKLRSAEHSSAIYAVLTDNPETKAA
ncbi:MAG: PTS IIA-like nitrogen regulatory protein PtsN [Pseudomonadota bacterium]